MAWLTAFQNLLSDITAPMRHLLRVQRIHMACTTSRNPASKKRCEKSELHKSWVKHISTPAKLLGYASVSYTSKSLTGNDAQVKKELNVILFGCKRFHQHVYGRHVTEEIDHKLLESIIRKMLMATPPVLQRVILQLQTYGLTIIHRPGNNISCCRHSFQEVSV